MPRLLRVHFSSIGHRDARLAPLTLDFRHASEERRGRGGTGADTVVWLRNGGGKSSILNLFYSVFRTRTREFLGSSAEGKARRLDQYVGSKDLAFVVTEWDVSPNSQLEMFARPPDNVRIVGQVLAWKGQQSSSDLTKLRRLFFTLRAKPGDVVFDDLPVRGLGAPVSSFDAFRDWLRESTHRYPDLEIGYTDSHKSWEQQLEKLGLDPELFRYQLQMNRREGAADEAFRFSSGEDFVRFLLELSFETDTAERLAKALDAQRLSLAQRPRYEREKDFLRAALDVLHPLSRAVHALEDARSRFASTLESLAAIVAGIRRQRDEVEVEKVAAAREQERAKRDAQAANNERDKKQRWVRGLERLTLQLRVSETRADFDDAVALQREMEIELGLVRAAIELRRVREIETEIEELKGALARSKARAEPLREIAARNGAVLHRVLAAEVTTLESRIRQRQQLLDDAKAEAETARERGDVSKARAAELKQEIRELGVRMDARDLAREKLLEAGLVAEREPAHVALARWNETEDALEARRELKRGDLSEAERELEKVTSRANEMKVRKAQQETSVVILEKELEASRVSRDALVSDPLIADVEGVEESNPDSPGLEGRLLRRAELARRKMIDSRVDGAEEQRALEAIETEGLLPPSRDVESVVRALREAGVKAHQGQAYLAANLPSGERLDFLLNDPARFGGAVVLDPAEWEKVKDVTVEGLRSPIQVSTIRDLEQPPPAPENPDDAPTLVLPPDAGLYDHDAAQEKRVELEGSFSRRHTFETEQRQLEQDLTERASDLRRYLEAYGHGKLRALAENVDALRWEIQSALGELAELRTRENERRAELAALKTEIDSLEPEIEAARQAVSKVQAFIEHYEQAIEAIRERRAAAMQELREAETHAERAREDEAKAHSKTEDYRERLREVRAQRDGLAAEQDSILYRDDSAPMAPTVGLVQARAAYDTARRQYEEEVGEDQLQWEMEAKRAALEKAAASFRAASAQLNEADVEEWAKRVALEDERERIDRDLKGQLQEVGSTKTRYEEAQRELGQSKQRREAEDLPAEQPRPRTSSEATARAAELQLEVEEAAETARRADATEEALRSAIAKLEREQQRRTYLAGELQDIVSVGAGQELPRTEGVRVPRDVEKLEEVSNEIKSRFSKDSQSLRACEIEARDQVDRVHTVANASRFSDLKLQHRERLKSTAEELFDCVGELHEGFDQRLTVIEKQLAQYDEDRRVLVDELLQLADQVQTILRRAAQSSTLPQSLEGWAGRTYLRIGFRFPESDEERRARLEPLVDRLVQQASIPSGLELVQLTARELAGSSGFDVKVLKPDTILRPDPVPIGAMTTFSRGQQLTSAILLYCTLVQLRARSRGKGRGPRDAGVLILDNPIGTCSSVALLKLQRTIASQMRVQLIYTTGVDDLEALETLPNKIRLKNTHRDRRTGDYHVTREADETEVDRGAVEGVRVIEVPAR